ncbi:MAG: regulatory iron-sulfur-containing complex subunit RicT [Patescibacteria group bacterium]|jgi:cell fate regulator YaaT (PSP1 superfamily)
MLIAQVQFAPWDKVYNFSLGEIKVVLGDYVVVETELGTELGKITSILTDDNTKLSGDAREIKPILRKAGYDDVAKLPNAEKKAEALEFCKEMVKKHDLPMKLVDVHFSFDAGRINFAFISDGRVDFRELVKDLAAHFGVNIRLTQIGTRDEAKITGDCGPCGQGLCCRGFLKEFSSITSEMAETQQVVHRGSERISGMCGRLMCCLSYEYEGYKEMAGQLPPIGTKVNVDGTRGVIVGHHILKQTVDVKISAEKEDERDIIIEVDINRHNKKK